MLPRTCSACTFQRLDGSNNLCLGGVPQNTAMLQNPHFCPSQMYVDLALDLLSIACQAGNSPLLTYAVFSFAGRPGASTEELLLFYSLFESLKELQQCRWRFKISPLCLGNTGRFKKSCLPPAKASICMNKAFILPAKSNGHAAITNQTPHAGGGDGAQTRTSRQRNQLILQMYSGAASPPASPPPIIFSSFLITLGTGSCLHFQSLLRKQPVNFSLLGPP